MADGSGKGTTSIALFVTQIVSAASGFVISASCLFLRRWHPPVAYTAAFNISFWIGVQAIITHTGSAISVRLPEASEDMQRNKALVRFLVWAQFAMPLWFVFLNASIATDLMLSQLFRLGMTRLQAIHKWYLPVATTTAFALALPLLIYHSAYQPQVNVFSVQFPSALSVTLYYILAFDVWLAAGIVYCFVVVSLVVAVLLVKLRRKRAVWRMQNPAQIDDGWLPLTPVTQAVTDPLPLDARHAMEHAIAPAADAGTGVLSAALLPPAQPRLRPSSSAGPSSSTDHSSLRTFARRTHPVATRTVGSTPHGKAVMSGVTFSDMAAAAAGSPTLALKEGGPSALNVDSSDPAVANQAVDSSDSGARPSLSRLLSRVRSGIHRTAERPAGERATWPRGLTLSLSNLPSFSSRSRSQLPLGSGTPPFRIPTLALVRLLLYPLIPILSFTLMCVVRWVWFRSNMPSRWEILNVVSGFLRALEGFLCLIVFLLNPALNRSFREIRKRNTPVFT
ncbi:hypothetical protein H4R19_003029 [Coemansia spiralis]|nr:hypothetical protein H4R19_003029 [Coemansia spiralis]